MDPSFLLLIEDSSQVGEARRIITSAAENLGFDVTQQGKLALIVTEAAGNLLKHAKRGKIVYRFLQDQPEPGIELLILDQGPGISDIGRCLRDGYSTAGTPGTGFGAIQRLSDYFEIYSQPSLGTAILSQVFAKPIQNGPQDKENKDPHFTVGAVTLPTKYETACGDRWAFSTSPNHSLFMVADGIGHGPKAAEAAEKAEKIFSENTQSTPEGILALIHEVLRPTRGAAISICEIIPEKKLIRYAGIGNVSGLICPNSLEKKSRYFVSLSGTVGHEVRRIQVFEYEWIPGSLLIMYSDGLMNRWKFDSYSGIKAKHPSIIAGILYRDFSRGTDDVTVVVAKAQ